jgi:hypothetical protein
VTSVLRAAYTLSSESRCALRRRLGAGSGLYRYLYVHSNLPKAYLQKVFPNKIKRVQACILRRRSWTSLPPPFIRAQRLSERTVECVPHESDYYTSCTVFINLISKLSCCKYCYFTILDETTTNFIVPWIYIPRGLALNNTCLNCFI